MRGGIIFDKSKMGINLGALSILSVIVSIVIFYIERGPNADVYFVITTYSILSISGIILAAISLWLSKRHISRLLIGLVGLTGNLAVLVFAFLLLLAMGISEP